MICIFEGSVMVDDCHFGLSQVRVILFYGPVEAVLEMAYELNGSSSLKNVSKV